MVTRFCSQHSFRIIAHRRNREPLAERLPSVVDRAALHEIEALTNPRIQQHYAARKKVRPEDIEGGDQNEMVIASFAYSGASRFTDGSYGIYYACLEFDTAIAESAYHTERFLSYTDTRPLYLHKRVLTAQLNGTYDDLRALSPAEPVYDPDPQRYAAAQAYARGVYASNECDGITYNSVRATGGTCVAVFRPRLISGCETAGFLLYAYDGRHINDMFRVGSLDDLRHAMTQPMQETR